nr:MAG TPA: hypothetical protein [Caudoviricetes sp.]DAU00907.1 MAG TPA: hypothetical protein [Caudoviricetes sp.]
MSLSKEDEPHLLSLDGSIVSLKQERISKSK